jgi:DNA-binding HxlR family transcriptional regulator
MDTEGVAMDQFRAEVEAIAAPRVCPATRVLDLVSHKWTITIILRLHMAGGPVRFRQLQRLVAPITQKELTKRLRELERSGLVARAIFAEVPPRVEYRLTDLGATLIPALDPLHQWAERHATTIDANQQFADEARSRAAGVGQVG